MTKLLYRKRSYGIMFDQWPILTTSIIVISIYRSNSYLILILPISLPLKFNFYTMYTLLDTYCPIFFYI